MVHYHIRKLGMKNAAEIFRERLSQGEVLITPTETIYGFSTHPFEASTITKLRKVKNIHKKDRPYILLVKDIAMAKRYTLWNHYAEKLAKQYWPGALTLRLQLKKTVRKKFLDTSPEGSVALRVSSHPFFQEVFKNFSFPIISTSANLTGEKPFGSLKEMKVVFHSRLSKPDAIFYEGKISRQLPSTIIDVTQKPKLIRQGSLFIQGIS